MAQAGYLPETSAIGYEAARSCFPYGPVNTGPDRGNDAQLFLERAID
jgi:hypothetical protein